MEKHKTLEKRLREKTGHESLWVYYYPQHKADCNNLNLGNGHVCVVVKTKAQLDVGVPMGEDCWMKLEEKILKLIAVLKE